MATEQTFQTQIIKTLAFEGGYSNDPDDPGGETNFGISKRSYPNEDIANMTRQRAIWIYHNDYWLRPKINQLPDAIAGKVFDIGVNMGSRKAIELLQETLNDYDDDITLPLVVDGLIGPATIAACFNVITAGGPLYSDYRQAVIDHYEDLIASNPTFEKYRNGWMRRANA